MNLLLVGLGRWGANHLRVFQSLPVELFASDLDPGKLEQARKLGVAASRLSVNYKDFLPRIDAAALATPAQTHFALCRQLLQSGKDVFVEKPLALKASEARTLAELAARRGRILQTGHIFRFDSASAWIRQALLDGRFGRVRLLRGHFGGFKRPRPDSGALFADGVHFVDLFNYFLEACPRSVLAIGHDFLGRGMEDASLLSLEYQGAFGQTWATVENDYFSPGKFRQITIVGEKASAVCDYSQPLHKITLWGNFHHRQGTDFKAIEGAPTQVHTPAGEPLQAELRAFVQSVQTRQRPLADGWSGYQAVRVIEAALKSARTGRAVKLRTLHRC